MGSQFINKTAVVTGGASGIGLATARRLADEGARVFLVDRDNARLRDVAAGFDADRLAGIAVADVSRSEDVGRAVARAIEQLGRIDVLVNNAGVYDVAPFLEIDEARWDGVLAIDLKGIFLVGQAVAREMARTGGGAIVNTSSIAAIVADAVGTSAHYNAAKAGVVNLTKQMAVELAPLGIRVNAVCPGVIDTPMVRREDVTDEYLRTSVPLRRLGRPEEVAAVIAFLASEEASYVTGEAVVVDGGVTLT